MAVKDAKRNIELNNMINVRMLEGKIEDKFPKKADVVVLDPPRVGCSPEALKAICQANPQRIVYVSCNPQSFARDLKYLNQAGYVIEKIQPVDMFPQTEHIEVVAKLSRGARSFS